MLSSIKESISLIVQLSETDVAVAHVQDMWYRKGFPSPSAMGKLRLRMDVSIIALMAFVLQQWLQQGTAVFVGADSSPQGGRDYLIIIVRAIKHIDMCGLLWDEVAVLDHFRGDGAS